MRHSIFLIVLLAVASGVAAQAYKWRDANGQIQYSDTPPPPGAKDVQQLRKAGGTSASASTAGAQSKSLAEQDAEFRKRLATKQEEDAKQLKAQQDEQVRARNCEQARGQLASLESGGRMVRFNEKGERITLDDADRGQAILEARKNVEGWCK
jgi:hypothetical protein